MNRNQISIATITWVRDDEEERLLRTALTELSKLEIPVYIADGGSNPGFLDFLRALPGAVLVEKKDEGLWGQVKSGFMEAYNGGAGFILYTEPDKKDFFQKGLPDMLERISIDEGSGIITAARSAAGFESFPAFQQMTETTINNCCAEITGYTMDYTYGPFLINRDVVETLVKVEERIGWGWRPCAFNVTRRLGYRLEAYTGDFYCPVEQRHDNPQERIYRMRQLQEHIEGVILSTKIPID